VKRVANGRISKNIGFSHFDQNMVSYPEVASEAIFQAFGKTHLAMRIEAGGA